MYNLYKSLEGINFICFALVFVSVFDFCICKSDSYTAAIFDIIIEEFNVHYAEGNRCTHTYICTYLYKIQKCSLCIYVQKLNF